MEPPTKIVKTHDDYASFTPNAELENAVELISKLALEARAKDTIVPILVRLGHFYIIRYVVEYASPAIRWWALGKPGGRFDPQNRYYQKGQIYPLYKDIFLALYPNDVFGVQDKTVNWLWMIIAKYYHMRPEEEIYFFLDAGVAIEFENYISLKVAHVPFVCYTTQEREHDFGKYDGLTTSADILKTHRFANAVKGTFKELAKTFIDSVKLLCIIEGAIEHTTNWDYAIFFDNGSNNPAVIYEMLRLGWYVSIKTDDGSRLGAIRYKI
jgi:hypothetical protein